MSFADQLYLNMCDMFRHINKHFVPLKRPSAQNEKRGRLPVHVQNGDSQNGDKKVL